MRRTIYAEHVTNAELAVTINGKRHAVDFARGLAIVSEAEYDELIDLPGFREATPDDILRIRKPERRDDDPEEPEEEHGDHHIVAEHLLGIAKSTIVVVTNAGARKEIVFRHGRASVTKEVAETLVGDVPGFRDLDEREQAEIDQAAQRAQDRDDEKAALAKLEIQEAQVAKLKEESKRHAVEESKRDEESDHERSAPPDDGLDQLSKRSESLHTFESPPFEHAPYAPSPPSHPTPPPASHSAIVATSAARLASSPPSQKGTRGKPTGKA